MIATLLDKVGAVQRRTSSKDAIGGDQGAYATRTGLDAVPCSIGPVSWATAQEFQREDSVVTAEIYAAVDVAATTQDRWLIEGVYYPVLAHKRYVNPIFGPSCFVTIAGRRN